MAEGIAAALANGAAEEHEVAVYLRGVGDGLEGWSANLRPGDWRLRLDGERPALVADEAGAEGPLIRIEPRAIHVTPGAEPLTIDGQPVTGPTRLRPGQTMAVAGLTMRLEAERADAPVASAPATTPAAPPPAAPAETRSATPDPPPSGIALPPPDPSKWRHLLRFAALLAVIAVAVGVWKAVPRAVSVEEQIPAEVRARVQAATVWVKAADAGSQGSGYVPKAGYVLTNAHVLNGGKDIKIIYNSGQPSARQVDAKVIKVGTPGTPNDLALLKVDTGAVSPLPLCDVATLSEGAVAAAFGFPLGSEMSLNQYGPAISIRGGKVTSLRKDSGRVEWVETDIPAEVGNSGGPVATVKGEVVGLATMIVGPNLRMALVASADMIRAFAPEVK